MKKIRSLRDNYIRILLITVFSAFLCCSQKEQITPPENSSTNFQNTGILIIADHTVVDKFDKIPSEWIAEVKKMWINVAGESHSLGYRKGVELLEILDSRFAVSIQDSGDPEPFTDQHLRISRGTWGDVTNATGWRYGYGEEDFYTSAQAVERTKAHLTYANTHNLVISAFAFGWCWDATWHNDVGGTVDPVFNVRWAGSSVGGPEGDMRWGLDNEDQALTGNSVSMMTYLLAVEAYITHVSANGYPTAVMFTTGPVDGGGNTGERGYQRYLKHQYIRDHAKEENRILFDYADILTHSDSGEQNLITWNSHSFPFIHNDNMMDFARSGSTVLFNTFLPHTEDGDHIGERGALRLGKAVWWILARIAGWDGN